MCCAFIRYFEHPSLADAYHRATGNQMAVNQLVALGLDSHCLIADGRDAFDQFGVTSVDVFGKR